MALNNFGACAAPSTTCHMCAVNPTTGEGNCVVEAEDCELCQNVPCGKIHQGTCVQQGTSIVCTNLSATAADCGGQTNKCK